MYIQRSVPFSFRAILASQVLFFLMVRAGAGGCPAAADRTQVRVRVQDDGSRRLTNSQRFLLNLPWRVVSGQGLVGEGRKVDPHDMGADQCCAGQSRLVAGHCPCQITAGSRDLTVTFGLSGDIFFLTGHPLPRESRHCLKTGIIV